MYIMRDVRHELNISQDKEKNNKDENTSRE